MSGSRARRPRLSVRIVISARLRFTSSADGIDTYTGCDAAGVGDAARQRPGRRAVVIHVDGPVFVLLTSAALKLPKDTKEKERNRQD